LIAGKRQRPQYAWGCTACQGVITRAVLDRIKAILSGRGTAPEGAGDGVDRLQLAAAALLVEAAQMDDDFGAEERAKIVELVERRFGLGAAASEALLQAASEKIEQSVDIFGFTREIKNAFSPQERVEMMEMLWEVAYSDGELHSLEAHLMRRLAGLLHVGDRESAEARQRVLARQGPES